MTRHLLVVAVLIVLLLLATVVALSVLRERERRRPGVLLDIVPPEGTTADLQTWSKFYRKLFGISYSPLKRLAFGQPSVVFELWSKDGDLGARCWAPARRAGIVTTLLRAAVPGVLLQKSTAIVELEGCAARSRLRLDADPLHALDDPQPEALRSVMQALAEAPSGLIQVAVTPDETWQRRALRKLDALAGLPPEHGLLTSALRWVLDGAFHLVLAERPTPPAPPARHSRPLPPASKAAAPGYRAEIRLRVGAASTGEAKACVDGLVAAFRGFDSITNGLRPARVWLGRRFDKAVASRSGPAGNMTLVHNELAGLFHLPIDLPGFSGAPPRLAPAKRPSPEGNIVCHLEDERQTPMRISPADALHHMQLMGPTGVGKTTLMMNLALGDIEAGRGIAVIDPKGDLVRDLLERIPRRHWDRVVLIDPSLREQPVGLNLLDCDDPDQHELVCDQLVTIFRKTYERFWGPRTDELLRAAVLTLLRRPDTSLSEVPLLLLQTNARRVLIEGLHDPVGLEPFWNMWDQKTDAQRLQEAGPVSTS